MDLRKSKSVSENRSQFSGTASDFFINDTENPYIPRVCRNFSHSLTRKRKTDELWMKQEFSVFQEGKCAIKVAATHANPVAVIVKGNHWRNYDIQCPGRDDLTALWLCKTILIEDKLAFGG